VIVPEEFRIFREVRERLILTLILHEGVNHVVRRIMESVGIPIVRLTRIRIGPLTLTGVPLGGWRELSPGEVSTLFEAIGLGSKEVAKAQRASRSQARQTAGRTIQFTRRPPRPQPAEPGTANAQTPAGGTGSPPTRTTGRHPPHGAQSTSDADNVKSRRRRGEPPAPKPKRPRPERAASDRRDKPANKESRPTKDQRPARGKNEERKRSGGPKSGGGTKQRPPKGGSDRRSRGGGENNRSKPRRSSSRGDAV
jgi:hypothetical protein